MRCRSLFDPTRWERYLSDSHTPGQIEDRIRERHGEAASKANPPRTPRRAATGEGPPSKVRKLRAVNELGGPSQRTFGCQWSLTPFTDPVYLRLPAVFRNRPSWEAEGKVTTATNPSGTSCGGIPELELVLRRTSLIQTCNHAAFRERGRTSCAIFFPSAWRAVSRSKSFCKPSQKSALIPK
jgi:hypothetical protein